MRAASRIAASLVGSIEYSSKYSAGDRRTLAWRRPRARMPRSCASGGVRMIFSCGSVRKQNWNDPPLPPSLKVRRLRVELGQTQQQVVDRARRDPQVSSTFAQSDVGKAEMREAQGLSAERVRLGI